MGGPCLSGGHTVGLGLWGGTYGVYMLEGGIYGLGSLGRGVRSASVLWGWGSCKREMEM